MKKYLLFIVIIFAIASLSAQTNVPVKLALICETDEALPVADILTAKLSSDEKIQLLERDQIEKVYHEQGMSAANRDDLKIGQILGADGLLLLDIVRTSQATNFTARLIAVKPGVMLTDGSFPWPLTNTVQWSESVVAYLDDFLPKLTLFGRDAIPISVVNLRSAITSVDAKEMERQLKLLTIQRLSQERQFFVLERQKMQLLGEEKELRSDESAFWDGSYLLEGIVDQNGYSPDKVIINARLTPPKGGAPMLFEVSGSRTNLAEVVNQLVSKITNLLKVKSSVPEWNATDEAAQYFNEAKWALKWGVFSEAQAASDSAWMLGKKDLNCALIRVRAYVNEIPQVMPANADSYIMGIKDVHYVHINEPPNPKYCDVALYALKCYYEFSRTSPEASLTAASEESNWKNSDWYNLGIEDLVAASQVLQHFNFVPESQKPVADKLAELRAMARSVAEIISQSPSVHNSYFMGDRIATSDELANTIGGDGGVQNIFSCELRWGCFWQERPEDCIALYRELMSSPVFCYIHQNFWSRDPIQPRLVAWNEEDRKRIPIVWNNFTRELNTSTNLLWQLEAKALQLADTSNDVKLAESFTNFFNIFFKNRDTLVANNIEVLYLDWGIGDLLDEMGGDSVSDTKNSLRHVYYSEYRPKIEAMDLEYRNKTVPAIQFLPVFEKQKQFLKNTEFNLVGFNDIFNSPKVDCLNPQAYSKDQALEIQPLIATYKSNIIAQLQKSSGVRRGQLMLANDIVGFLEDNVNRIINPTASNQKIEVAQKTNVPPVRVVRPKMVLQIPKAPLETLTNILLAKKYLKIPSDRFTTANITSFRISASHWSQGKLLFDLVCSENYYTNGFEIVGGLSLAAAAIYDPIKGNWEVVEYPEHNTNGIGVSYEYRNIELFKDELYLSVANEIYEYNFGTQQWKILNISGQNNSRLIAVNGHLYAANDESIFEITDDGRSTHILASIRRRPAVTVLDSLDRLDSPQLFSGPNHLLYASIGNKIYSWDGNDWHEILNLNISQPPEIFDDAIIFRSIPNFGSDDQAHLWLWNENQTTPELCLSDKPKPHPGLVNWSFPKNQNLHPRWKSINNDYLTSSTAAFFKSNLYFFVDHAIVTNVSGHWTVAEMDGYHAKLVCLDRDSTEPIVVPLKFDLEQGQPPLKSLGEKFEQMPWQTAPAWMYFTKDTLYIGQPDTLGIWAIPVSEVEAAIAVQKQIQLAQQAQAVAAVEQVQKNLLAKYDLNHNGIIDSNEREAALDDPVFIESQLDVIDANHNGRLDLEELAYFDANQNKILESKEQAGIDIAQHLLAERLLKKFDTDGDGVLNNEEFQYLWQSNLGVIHTIDRFFIFAAVDRNHDRFIDSDELEVVLKQQTRRALQRQYEKESIERSEAAEPRGMPGAAFMNQIRMKPDQAIDVRQLFKMEVEAYWRNIGSATNHPPHGATQ